jgi:hypothetical protein
LTWDILYEYPDRTLVEIRKKIIREIGASAELLSEGFGVFLPFRFISVIDILRAPQVKDFSMEANFGIGSVV